MNLAPLINHPGMPWGFGGLLGAITGAVFGQPDCSGFLQPCTLAELPFVNVPTQPEGFMAIGTILGFAAAFVYGRVAK